MDSFAILPSCPIAGSLCCFPSPLKLHLSWKFIYWHSSLLLVGYLYLLEIPPLPGFQQNTPVKIKLRCWLISCMRIITQFNSVKSLSHVRLFVTPWISARQASLSITNSWSLLKLIKSVMPSSHLILCRFLLLLPPIPPSIMVFSNESALHMRWPKYWSFSFNISPSNEHLGLISFRTGWISLQSKGLSRVFSNTTDQKHQFFNAQLSSQSNYHIHT